MSDDIASLGFRVDTSGLTRGERALDSYGRRGAATESRINRSVDNMNNRFNSLQDTIGFVGAALATLGLAGLAGDVVRYSDSWTLVNSQLKQVTTSEEDLIKVRSELLAVTRETRSALAGTVDLYAEMSRSTSDMGISSSRLIDITKTINNLFLAGGKSAAETAGAIRQLNQGFASGVLRGDEFNSVAEGAPKIMDALSKSLKMTRGELREFAATGGITSQIMVTALESYSVEAQRLADTTSATFGQMAVLAKTNATEFVGQQQSIQGAVQSAGESLVFMSESLGSLVDAGKAFIAVYGVAVTAAMVNSTAAAIASATASRAAAIATAQASSTAAVAASALAVSEARLAAERVASAGFTVAALEAEAALEAVRLKAQISQIGRMHSQTRLAEIRVAQLAITRQLTLAEAQLSATTSAATVATGAQSVATANLARAQGVATIATTSLGVATKFLLGPWGLLLMAVGAAAAMFLSSKDDSESLREELDKQVATVKSLEQEYDKLNGTTINSNAIATAIKVGELEFKRLQIIKDIDKHQNTLTGHGMGFNSSALVPLRKELDLVNDELKSANATADALFNIFTNRKTKALDDAIDKAKKADKAYSKWLSTVSGFQAPLQKVTSEIEKVNAAILAGSLKPEGGTIQYLTILSEKLAQLNVKSQDNSYQEWLDEITSASTLGKLQSLQDEIAKVQKAMGADELSFEVGTEKLGELEKEIISLKKTVDKTDVFGGITGSISESLRALRGFTSEGSKEYAKLSVAADAFNAIQAISAVINQAASGDPFSAFPRMAAMIGAMASLGQSIGSLGGDLSDTSAANQTSQGANVWGDKASSISDSIDMTASATDKLVGINTDMLDALKGMQQGIFAAAGISAKATQSSTFDISSSKVNSNPLEGLIPTVATNMFDVVSLGMFSKIFKGIGKALGGSRKVTDQGIKIVGGSLDDLINSVSVSAFQEVKSKKYAWSSTKVRTYLTPISGASAQFALVFGSLADSVFAGATSLGFASEDVEKAINEFNVATTKISLKGLSIEAQTAQIEAVFSKVFNGLSVAVIPFLSEFQQTGEELGETLARLSTQVAVAEFAANALGIELGDKLANPKLFTQISENLANLTGGIEEFASKTASFTDTFSPNSVKLSVSRDALTRSLDEVGLALPSTADGFFMLMQGLNGTTEAGQKQIATLLNVQDTASDYFKLVADYTDELTGLSSSLESAISGIFGVSRATTNLSIDSALAAAKLGDFSKALGLDLSKVSANQSEFGSISEFKIQQATTANKLSELNDLTMGSASISDMTLTANQEQVSLLTSIDSNISSTWVPQQTQIQSNDDVVVELKALRADIELIKDASESIAKSTSSTEDDIDAIRRSGLDVRLEA